MPSSNGHARAEQGKSHHEGWDEALDEALKNASVLGPPGTYQVTVTFSATVEVTNPGTIQGYTVTLNPNHH
jgi:hypothetical protein